MRAEENKEIKPLHISDVVRTIIAQPLSMVKLEDCLRYRSPEKVELVQSLWIVKDPKAQNPGNIMPVGGKISEEDEKTADRLYLKDEIPRTQGARSAAKIKTAACREAADEIHLQGVRMGTVRELLAKPRMYSFGHSTRGLVTNKEYWTGIVAESEFKPHAFFTREDKISAILSLSLSRVEQMFEKGTLILGKTPYYLVDNLIADPELRNAPVTCDSGEVTAIHQSVIDFLRNTEMNWKCRLAEEMREFCPYSQSADICRVYDQLTNAFAQRNWETFNEAYRNFFKTTKEKIPYEKHHAEQKDETLKRAMLQAWHRVIFKSSVTHAAEKPIQGEYLAARLPLEEATTDEREALEEYGPEYFKKMMHFIQKALTVDDKNFPDLGNAPRTAEETYLRLELYRRLKVNQAAGLTDNELLLLRLWHRNFSDALQKTFGITPFEFVQYSSDHNGYFEGIRLNVALQASTSDVIPTRLARSPLTFVSQLDELLLVAHGYNPYRDIPRGEGVSRKDIYDVRMKLASIPLWQETNEYYYPAIGRSTYFWRQTLDRLFAQFSGSDHEDYIISASGNGTNKLSLCPSEKSPQSGIAIRRIKTGLSLDDIPIFILENTRDKTKYSLRRKGDERSEPQEKIRDVYGTAITVDSTSAEIVRILSSKYHDYWINAVSHLQQPIPFQQWRTNWGKRVITEILAPTIKNQARLLGYIYGESEEKDRLDSSEATAGSAASRGGLFRELKYYAYITPNHPLAEKTEDEQIMEVTYYPTVEDFYTKYTDDNEYALRRFEMVIPGSGRYSLWNLYYFDEIYTDAYSNLAGRRARINDAPQTPPEIKRRIVSAMNRLFHPSPPIIIARNL